MIVREGTRVRVVGSNPQIVGTYKKEFVGVVRNIWIHANPKLQLWTTTFFVGDNCFSSKEIVEVLRNEVTESPQGGGATPV